MRISLSLALLLVILAVCSAYVSPTAFAGSRGLTSLQMAVDLAPEPEGGEEMQSIDTMAGSRMKNMGENSEVASEDGTVYDFWLSGEADGALIKEIRIQIEKDAKKKAKFPGFRPGQIPPYVAPQITGFAVQEGLIKTVEAAVGAYGLKAIPGSDGEVNINEDVKEMCKGYKTGDTLAFTANFRALLDPEKSRPDQEEESSEDSFVDEVETSAE